MSVVTSKFAVPGGDMTCRHNELMIARESLLFIHGLGESGLCFIEAFNHPLLGNYNILVPDLIGFGRSAGNNTDDYSFDSQVKRLIALLDVTGIQRVHVIGHSMGGDLGTLFCEAYPARALSLVNIEGNLTPDDRFITAQAVAAQREGRFEQWLLNDLAGDIVVNWALQWPTCIRYIASLQMCSPAAFLASAEQLYELDSLDADDGQGGIIGLKYLHLTLPKIYCLGCGRSSISQAFLENHALLYQSFPDAFHWIMLDTPKTFYRLLADFLLKKETS